MRVNAAISQGHALDGATLQGNWVKRRAISDALLDAWAGPAVDGVPPATPEQANLAPASWA